MQCSLPAWCPGKNPTKGEKSQKEKGMSDGLAPVHGPRPGGLPTCFKCQMWLSPRKEGEPEKPNDLFMLGTVTACREHANTNNPKGEKK